MITIIIPVYNAELYVERAIRSVLAQTYAGKIECIIVDDGSTDSTPAIIAETLGKYHGSSSFRIIRHDNNRGLSDARNTGLDAARGEYVLFLDSDDELTVHALSLFATSADKHPDSNIIAGEYYLSPQMTGYRSHHLPHHIKGKTACCKALLREGTILDMAHNKLINLHWIRSNHLRFYPGIFHEDNLWRWDCAKHAEGITILSDPTMIYFSNPGSITANRTDKHIRDILTITRHKLATIDPDSRRLQVRNIIINFTTLLLNLIIEKNSLTSPHILSEATLLSQQIRLEALHSKSIRTLLSMILIPSSLGPNHSKLSILRLRMARRISKF